MKFKNYLTERSYLKTDIPKYFYVVFDLENSIDSLKKRKFENLKGISSSNEIQFQFLGVARDAMLKMPSDEIMKINHFTRVMYSNPHYMVSQNLLALRRIYNATGNNWAQQVFGNLLEYMHKITRSKNKEKYNQFTYDGEYYGIRNFDWNYKISRNIETLKDLAFVVKTYIDKVFSEKTGRKYDISLKEYYDILFDTLKFIGKIYKSENEWIIKDKYLSIPKNSTLIVLVPWVQGYDQKIMDFIGDFIDKHPEIKLTSPFEVIKISGAVRDAGLDKNGKFKLNQYIAKYRINKRLEKLNGMYNIEELEEPEFKSAQAKYFKDQG